jgi:solute carrier family 27 fatty acid transporter 1/4
MIFIIHVQFKLYLCIRLGLSKIGVIPALVNINLRNAPLLHTIKVVNCKAIIYGLELQSAIYEIQDEILEQNNDNFSFYHSIHGSDMDAITSTVHNAVDLDEELKACSTKPEPEIIAKSIGMMDSLCYIYTSGTTGLPKAVDITHFR